MLIKERYMMLNLIKLREIREHAKHWRSNEKFYDLREVLINPNTVVMLYEDKDFKDKLNEFNKWPSDLNKKSIFTKIYLNNGTQNSPLYLYVVGALDSIGKKLGSH